MINLKVLSRDARMLSIIICVLCYGYYDYLKVCSVFLGPLIERREDMKVGETSMFAWGYRSFRAFAKPTESDV